MMNTPLPALGAITAQASRQGGLNRQAGSADQDRRGVRLRANHANHAAIDRRRVFRRIRAQTVATRTGHSRTWTGTRGTRDLEGPRHAALGAVYRTVFLRLYGVCRR